ncbi:hypothetical protein [Tropicimonas sp. S265A]|uniref:hypothetical protein n=1 Tax=Tropicimonas sp. S265A TaxID=3415134 RepID=UPI003C7E56D7
MIGSSRFGPPDRCVGSKALVIADVGVAQELPKENTYNYLERQFLLDFWAFCEQYA